MARPAPGIVCRRATPDDYEAVLDINRFLYSGMDYLAERYMRYVNDPQTLMYLLEKEGKVIAFTMRTFVDGGETGVNEAQRVLPEFQGKGFMEELMSFVEQDSRKSFPQMKRTAWTSINRTASDLRIKKHADIHLKVVRPRVSFDLTPNWIRNLSCEPMSSTFQRTYTALTSRGYTRALTPTEALKMLCSIPDMSTFAPEGYFIVDWRPFKAEFTNYQQMTRHCQVIASYEADDPNDVEAFSFGTTVRVKAGIRHRIDFYCRKNNGGVHLALAHIIKNIIVLSHLKVRLPINVGVLLPQEIDREQIKRHLVEDINVGHLSTKPDLTNDALLLVRDQALSKL